MTLSIGFGTPAAGTTAATPAYPAGIPAGAQIYCAVINKPQTVLPTAPTDFYLRTNPTGGASSATSGLLRVPGGADQDIIVVRHAGVDQKLLRYEFGSVIVRMGASTAALSTAINQGRHPGRLGVS